MATLLIEKALSGIPHALCEAESWPWGCHKSELWSGVFSWPAGKSFRFPCCRKNFESEFFVFTTERRAIIGE